MDSKIAGNVADSVGECGLRRPPLSPAELRAPRGFQWPAAEPRSKYVAPISRYVRVDGKRKPRPEYAALRDAVQRCTNPNNHAFDRYGGRGIRVCDRWLGEGGFDRFYADLGPRPSGWSLDRIDNEGDYEPDNCRWASEKTQQRNKRDNRPITIAGETMCLVAWAERYGVPRRRLSNRLAAGWDPLVALTAPNRADKVSAHLEAGRSPARETARSWGASRFRGVSRSHKSWGAIVTVGGKQRWLGTFGTEEEAARAYDAAARELHEHPVLNFPEVA